MPLHVAVVWLLAGSVGVAVTLRPDRSSRTRALAVALHRPHQHRQVLDQVNTVQTPRNQAMAKPGAHAVDNAVQTSRTDTKPGAHAGSRSPDADPAPVPAREGELEWLRWVLVDVSANMVNDSMRVRSLLGGATDTVEWYQGQCTCRAGVSHDSTGHGTTLPCITLLLSGIHGAVMHTHHRHAAHMTHCILTTWGLWAR